MFKTCDTVKCQPLNQNKDYWYTLLYTDINLSIIVMVKDSADEGYMYVITMGNRCKPSH